MTGKLTRREICDVFDVPPWFIGPVTRWDRVRWHATRPRRWWRNVVSPWIKANL